MLFAQASLALAIFSWRAKTQKNWSSASTTATSGRCRTHRPLRRRYFARRKWSSALNCYCPWDSGESSELPFFMGGYSQNQPVPAPRLVSGVQEHQKTTAAAGRASQRRHWTRLGWVAPRMWH